MTDTPNAPEPSADQSSADQSSAEAALSADPCAANPSDCKDAVERLYEFLDGELTSEKRTSISNHIDACGHCLDAYEFHTELKIVISKKCHTDLPVGLRDRVFDALRALDT